MKTLRTFISAVLAGMSIGLGGIAFLSVDNKYLGSVLFTVGLFVICTFGLNLFTGKVCYVFNNNGDYAKALPVIWLGNLAGTSLAAFAVRLSRIAPIAEKAAGLCETKLNDSLFSLFILGILCNILIYIAVESYKKNPHEIGKYLGLFFGVCCFILSGTEHCVADMFYFTVSGSWCGRAIACIAVITLGNAAGGVLYPLLRKMTEKGS